MQGDQYDTFVLRLGGTSNGEHCDAILAAPYAGTSLYVIPSLAKSMPAFFSMFIEGLIKKF